MGHVSDACLFQMSNIIKGGNNTFLFLHIESSADDKEESDESESSTIR